MNFTAMVEPNTDAEYDIHAQNPDQGGLSVPATATGSGAAAGGETTATGQHIGHPAMALGDQYGDFSYAHGAPHAQAAASSYGSHPYSASPTRDYENDGGGVEESRVNDAEEELEAAVQTDQQLHIDPQRLSQPLKLFVGQVPKNMTEEDLAFIFEPYGRILDLTVIRDRRSGNHRGCAFVTYESGEDAVKVVSDMHGKYKFDGAPWPAQVRPAAGEIDEGISRGELEGKNTHHACALWHVFITDHLFFSFPW